MANNIMYKQAFLITVLAVSVTLGYTVRKETQRASCPPKPPTVTSLETARYVGTWYEMQGIPEFFSPSGSKCISAHYEMINATTISVRNTLITPEGEYQEICGYADQDDPQNHPGDLTVHFPNSADGHYWLLATDYESFASVYSCEDFLGAKIEYGWVLTRDSIPNQEAIDKSRQAFTENGIDLAEFEDVEQSDTYPCFFEPPNGEPNCLEGIHH